MGYDRPSYLKNKADALFRMGFHAEVTGRIAEAAAKYEQAIRTDPSHYQSYVQLSRLYERQGDSAKAARYMEAAERSRLPASSPSRTDDGPVRRIERSSPPQAVARVLDAPGEEPPDPERDAEIKALLPHVWEPFFGRFDSLREVQRRAVPLVLKGENAMVISPTASGKTEAIFAPLAERIKAEGWKGLSVLYICPTKALAEDIAGRLEVLVDGLGIRVAQRNGDTKTLDARDPQDILVTTPESLDSLLSWSPEVLLGVRAVVLDELHMVDGNYRGDQLRVLMRRLVQEVGIAPSVYATSATVSEPEQMAARYMDDAQLVRASGGRSIDYRIVPSFEQAAKAFHLLGCHKALLFCNTPQEAEELARTELKRLFPRSTVKVHHGKLDATRRLEAERALRTGSDVVCACTSTLEVGVDIGDIDLVVLVRRPRSIASLSQRIGRGNRREDRMRVVAVASTVGEATYYEKVFQAVTRSQYDTARYEFDPSVAVQQILSSLSGGKAREEAFIAGLFERILPEKDLRLILAQLADNGWIARDGDDWKATDKCRELGPKLFSNIPGYDSIQVEDMATGEPVGSIALPIDNIFVLAGQAWLVRKRERNRVLVTKVEEATEVANFSSYDRFGAFFDLLPLPLRTRVRQSREGLDKDVFQASADAAT